MKNQIFPAATYCLFLYFFITPVFAQQIDPSFSINGRVITPIGNAADRGIDMAIDNSDRIVVAGQTFNGTDNDIAVVRYNADGTHPRPWRTGRCTA